MPALSSGARAPFAVRPAPGFYANAAQPRRADPAALQSLAGQSMGTRWSLRFHNPAMLPLDAVRAAVESALDTVVAQMSTWAPDATISRYNRAPAGTRHALQPEFATVLRCALRWAQASDGALDPSIGPLVSLWGFGAHALPADTLPGADAVAAARARVDWRRLEFDVDSSTLLQPGGAMLDLSGIAKGFAVDLVAGSLRALGLANFLIEIGGELRAAGRRPGNLPWQVQLEAVPGAALHLGLSDGAVASSGDRWHRHAVGDRHWSHTIDPRSGTPAAHALATVSVLQRDCMEADALATVLTVLGPDAGLAFAEAHRVPALFVLREPGQGWRTLSSTAWPVPPAA